ncbi:MAG: hypothetical protein O3A53_04540 [Acidobacteria bacterium]|nr:hypothetical protein [Acidobacteriota bacterium]MDA1234048.1 hypothetical protein [Acidobacteriota bacterium]
MGKHISHVMKEAMNSHVPAFAWALLTAMWVLWPCARVEAQELRYAREYPVMRYASQDPTDRVARLQRMIADGQARLSFEAGRGYLASLLASLDVPASSQMLVFSGTSIQKGLISADRPRAIYFADDVYVAWLQGSDVLEIAALDANLGPVFYTLRQEPSDKPNFQRHTVSCLRCHDTYGLTGGGVPRFLIGSGPTDAQGKTASHEGWALTTDQTPLSRRWGGWYVTGAHGDQHHAGNIVVRPTEDPAPAATGNLSDLSGLLDTDPYLTGHSDIVALMVVEHQLHVQNLLTRLNWESHKLLAGQAEPSQIAALVEPLVAAMLFVNEAKLSGPISGTSGFRADFESRGPIDGDGRSLRQLDLTRRLFKYPMSYLVYSEAFDGLPTEAKEQVFRRVWEVLEGVDRSEQFDHLSVNDRTTVLEILRDTKADFASWVAVRVAQAGR